MARKTKKPIRRVMNENQKKAQFKPGQSGNPSGRPPGTPNFKTVIRALLEHEVSNTAAATFWKDRRKITAMELLAVALFRKALKGDVGAIREVIDRSGETVAQTINHNLSDEDNAILDSVLTRDKRYAEYAARTEAPEPSVG